MKNNNMKEQILKKGVLLVSEKGFKNTGISEILKAVSVPKGSFYYYFSSKTDFGIQLIKYAAEDFFSELESYFSPEIPPLKRIENYFDNQIQKYSGAACSCNCLFGKLSQELVSEEPAFQKELADIFITWQNCFSKALREAEEAGEINLIYDARVMARFALSGWEGAIIQGKILQSLDPLLEFRKIFFSILH
ncbi:MAG: TetR family transcriptional regulator C-terminal domain-containing protein [Spirochaetales bacterium]|nr:TetR family transcriptional regulator C-terminal domain-containing protein [Spirochaetales bacterium]